MLAPQPNSLDLALIEALHHRVMVIHFISQLKVPLFRSIQVLFNFVSLFSDLLNLATANKMANIKNKF